MFPLLRETVWLQNSRKLLAACVYLLFGAEPAAQKQGFGVF